MILSEITQWLSEQPMLLPILFLALIFAYFVHVIVKDLKVNSSRLPQSAIKESMDKLPVGLSFYYTNGGLIYSNQRMNELSHAVVGKVIQDAAGFWQRLSSGRTEESVTCLEKGDHPTFRLADDSVWAFSREEVGGMIQLSASEITLIQQITDELKAKNEERAEINKHLRKYDEKVDELTRSKERFEAKASIHREFGQALLVNRKYILGDAEKVPFDSWETIGVMLSSDKTAKEEDPLTMFMEAAKSANVKITTTGTLPQTTKIKNLFLLAAVEALVNAVRHAEATILRIQFVSDSENHTVRFTNDGTVPIEAIIEGGGLGSLRHKVESVGGSMKVEHEPEFSFTLSVPIERSEES